MPRAEHLVHGQFNMREPSSEMRIEMGLALLKKWILCLDQPQNLTQRSEDCLSHIKVEILSCESSMVNNHIHI